MGATGDRFAPPRCGLGRRLAIAAIAAVATLAPFSAGPALANVGGSVSEMIYVAPQTRSVTVSPASIDMCSSVSPLTFPNGSCGSPGITVTNGPVGGEIDVQSAPAVPSEVASDPGTSPPDWTLCGTSEAPCTGASDPSEYSPYYPGQDQYEEWTDTEGTRGPYFTSSAQCDTAFGFYPNTTCIASPEQSVVEFVAMTGPSASTDTSSTFTSSVTWTAVP